MTMPTSRYTAIGVLCGVGAAVLWAAGFVAAEDLGRDEGGDAVASHRLVRVGHAAPSARDPPPERHDPGAEDW